MSEPPPADDGPETGLSSDTMHGPIALAPGTRVGRYTIRQLVGAGGFGNVYLADQSEPVRRRVAIKIIKRGMDSRQVITRFEAERQALALLDHPGVAHVLDAGTTDCGRPYFVMEYVPGEPINEYCDRHKLSTRERLELIVQACAAVQHAHQKGIIHRDIKPANILVMTGDESPQVKIIDFGVAKAISARLTDRTLVTEHGQLIGTPEYMSPEQAEMGALDVDTRADIYSLGVVMYELIAGRLPFEPGVLRSAPLIEVQRIIRNEDPPRPSTRIVSLGDDGAKIAEKRRTDIRLLEREVRGDLDWITMKAMEKDRTRRYAAPAGLALDIGRHLRHEPVSAGPPGRGYLIRKFVRRHKVAAAAGAVVVSALLLATAVSSTMAVIAQRAQQKASAAETTALNLAAGSSATAARLAAQRGRWESVIDHCDNAIQSGHDEWIDLRLRQVEAYVALDDTAEAARLVEMLHGRDDLGHHRGRVLLWRGEIKLAGMDDDARRDSIVEALKHELPPADAAYAQALVAPSRTEKLARLGDAITIDPFFHRATAAKIRLLLSHGQADEARRWVEHLATFVPDDERLELFRAMLRALEGELDAEDGGVIVAVAEFLTSIDPRAITVRDPEAERRLGERIANPATGAVTSPMVHEILTELMAGFTEIRDIRTLEDADAVLRRDPDGTVHFMRARMLQERNRLEDAAAAYRAAAATPALIPVRDLAVACEAVCVARLVEDGDRERRERLLECLRLVDMMEDLPADVVVDLAPANLIRRDLAGDHAATLRIADQILERDPDHAMAQTYRARAIEQIRKLATPDIRPGP